jgi:Tfp pilus assembly protein PilF
LSLPLALVLCAVAALLAGTGSLGNDFAYDDSVIIVGNPVVTDPAQAAGVWNRPYWGNRTTGGLFRPLTVLTYQMNHHLHGLQPFGFHLVNVLLHVLVTLLVVLVARKFLTIPAAFAAGLIFAVHPVHTEAVANVVGRAELLAALGFLGGWVLYAQPPGDRTTAHRVALAVAFFLAVLSKENAIVLPAALLLHDAVTRRRPDWPTFILLGITAAGYLLWRNEVLGSITNLSTAVIQPIDNIIASLPPASAFWTALSVIGRYAVLLVVPYQLSADYSYAQITAASPGSPWAWLGLIVVISVAALLGRELLKLLRRQPADSKEQQALTIGVGLFAVTLLPVSNLVFPIGTIMAERLVYLPSVGFVLAITAAGAMAVSRSESPLLRKVLIGATAVAVLLGAARSHARNRDWKDDATLHAVTVQTSPGSARAHYNHGSALFERGDAERGLAELNQAVQLDPTYTDAWTNLGVFKLRLKQFTEARADLLKSVAVDSTRPSAWIALSALEIVDNNPRAAVGYVEKALELEPNSVDAWVNLALARAALQDTAGTIEAGRKAADLNTRDPDVYDNLAWYLLMSGGQLDEAQRNAEKAVALRPDAVSFETLGAVHFRAGRWAEARDAWSRALSLNPPNAEDIRQRLALIADR